LTFGIDPGRALGYANRVIAAIKRNPSPKILESDWRSRRTRHCDGLFHQPVTSYMQKQGVGRCDKNMKAALPVAGG